VHLSPTGFDSATWLAALIKNHPFERCTPDAALANVHQNQNQNSEAASPAGMMRRNWVRRR
jgi:hypothetical protein